MSLRANVFLPPAKSLACLLLLCREGGCSPPPVCGPPSTQLPQRPCEGSWRTSVKSTDQTARLRWKPGGSFRSRRRRLELVLCLAFPSGLVSATVSSPPAAPGRLVSLRSSTLPSWGLRVSTPKGHPQMPHLAPPLLQLSAPVSLYQSGLSLTALREASPLPTVLLMLP